MKRFSRFAVLAFLLFAAQTVLAQDYLNSLTKLMNIESIEDLKKIEHFAKELTAGKSSPARATAARAAVNTNYASHVNDAFTSRAIFPDYSSSTKEAKIYYIKNVKTGEYLQYNGDDVPMTTTKERGSDATKFYFVTTGLQIGEVAQFCNVEADKNRNVDYASYYYKNFKGPGKGWTEVRNSGYVENGVIYLAQPGPKFYLRATEDKRGFIIQEGDKSVTNDIWFYDFYHKELAIGALNEYSVWTFECEYENTVETTPADTEPNKANWYVIKNVETGKYLHFNGLNSPLNSVISPDTCSLFYFTESGDNKMLHSYVAGTELEYGGDGWYNGGTSFVIEETEDERVFHIRWNDYYLNIDNNGTLVIDPDKQGTWVFERKTGFKEIFGLVRDLESSQFFEKYYKELVATPMPSLYHTYTTAMATLIYALTSTGSHLSLEDAQNFVSVLGVLEIFQETYEPYTHKEVKITNRSYYDDEKEEQIIRNLATNTNSLVANDRDYLHTNIWQVWCIGSDNILENIILYNNATKMYVGKPVVGENEEITVPMTPNLAEAGRWKSSFSTVTDYEGELPNTLEGTIELFLNYLNFEGTLMSADLVVENPQKSDEGYYLILENKDDAVIKCKKFNTRTDAEYAGGCLWYFDTNDAKIEEKFYNHAADVAREYPYLLQTQYGLVQDACECYFSLSPAADVNSSTCNLVDGNNTTAFWTEEGANERVLGAYVGESGISSFYFYMKPNANRTDGCPVRISIYGNDTPSMDGMTKIGETIITDALFDEMCYFSPKIECGASYKYLGFVIDEVNTGEVFTLSEFYIYPDNTDVANASEVINAFNKADYLSEEIVAPAVELVKLKATFYLAENKNNHAERPGIGQYPTSKYNALQAAADAVTVNDFATIDNLNVALEEFLNSMNYPVGIIEAAWEDGPTNGLALSFGWDSMEDDEAIAPMAEANIWDLRQWAIITPLSDEESLGNKNIYNVKLVSYGEEVPVNIDVINGWNTLYHSKRDAYNFGITEEGVRVNFCIDLNNLKYAKFTDKTATTTENQEAAWYITTVTSIYEAEEALKENYNSSDDQDFVEILADFGLTYKKAIYYDNEVRNSNLIYREFDDELTKYGFDTLFVNMELYYDRGPVEFIRMHKSGLLAESTMEYLATETAKLQAHFPHFVRTYPVSILESAWEDGNTNGLAITVDKKIEGENVSYEYVMAKANMWDVRQWVEIAPIEDGEFDPNNPYRMRYIATSDQTDMNESVINGWNELYASKLDAYNIYWTIDDAIRGTYNSYLSIDTNNENEINVSENPATTESNKNNAWYKTHVITSEEAAKYLKNDYTDDADWQFIEALALFGETFEQAVEYYNGEKSGKYIYLERGGLALDDFKAMYDACVYFYNLGPAYVLGLQNERDDFTEDEAIAFKNYSIALAEYFPNFVLGAPVCILESAWEDGPTKGLAVTAEGYGSIAEVNMWDVRQWVMINQWYEENVENERNPYALTYAATGNGMYINVDKIEGWNNLYDSKLDAYNIYRKDASNAYYLSIDGNALAQSTEPATATSNKNSAWYQTFVMSAEEARKVLKENYISESDVKFVATLADFGKTFAQAIIYNDRYNKGIYKYEENNGLTKSGFDEIYNGLKPYYDMGVIGVVTMHKNGQIDEDMVDYLAMLIGVLKNHFPNFVSSTVTGSYYRFRHASSNNYLLTEIKDGAIKMGSDDAMTKSIFYVLPGNVNNVRNIMAFNTGRYIKANGNGFELDKYPLDDNEYDSQTAYIYTSVTGTAGCNAITFEQESNYLYGNNTNATLTAEVDGENAAAYDWVIEPVNALPVEVSAAQMTSLCVPVELVIPEGVTVYILTGREIANGNHTYAVNNEPYKVGTAVFNIEAIDSDIIPAGMPVIIKAAPGTHYFTINYIPSLLEDEELVVDLKERNLLEGTHDARLISERPGVTHMILSKKNDRVGMYKVTMTSAADRGLDYVTSPTFINQAHRAWLPFATTQSVAGYSFAIGGRGDGTTDIEEVKGENAEVKAIYDLQGRKVLNPSRGVYIIDGKKFIVK